MKSDQYGTLAERPSPARDRGADLRGLLGAGEGEAYYLPPVWEERQTAWDVLHDWLDRAAYNKSARTFQDLFVLTLKRGGTERRFLAMKVRKNRIKVLYALRESVTQTGSADVLPSDAKIVDAVREAAVEYIARRTP